VVRIVEGISGRVPMRMQLTIRFGYGQIVPWVRSIDGRLHAIAGPDALVLATPVPTRGENLSTVADFTVEAHVALINTARNLASERGPARHRRDT
jgi:uncharacterized radical SAM superfamily protein